MEMKFECQQDAQVTRRFSKFEDDWSVIATMTPPRLPTIREKWGIGLVEETCTAPAVQVASPAVRCIAERLQP